jgi:hypothetical protein
LRAKRLDGARQLLDVPGHKKCHFRNLITRNETWIDLDMKPRTIWLPADAELPVRIKRTIARERCMLIIFWGIHGIAQHCGLSKDSTLYSPFFCEEVLNRLAQKMQPNSKKFANP